MLSLKAVDDFLDKPREDFTWLKSKSKGELDAALRGLVPEAVIKRLRLHQKACLLLGTALQTFCFWLDMGTGKTLLSLELIRYWFSTEEMVGKKALVVVPTDEVLDTWEEQIQKWMPDIPYAMLRKGATSRKWDQFDELEEGIVVVSYPGLCHMVTEFVKKKKGKKVIPNKKRLKPIRQLIDTLCENLGALILDESTKCSKKTSLTWRVCKAIAKQVPIRYALAGRPFGRDPMPLWAQFNLIDDGSTLGPTQELFREVFYRKKRGYWSMFEYKFDSTMEPFLNEVICNRSIRYSVDECIDMPKRVCMVEKTGFTDDAQVYYQKMVAKIISSKGNLSEMKNVFLRMRQISSGFVGFRNDETGDRAEVEFPDNPKLELLLQNLEELPRDGKAVVFYEFNWSGRRIVEELKARGIGYAWIWGGTKDSKKEKARFLTNPDCQVFLVNWRKGAYGVDRLQEVANYTFFYESPVSVIDREQAERRVWRDGQKKRVIQKDLVIAGTMDERILTYHKLGDSLMNAIFKNPGKLAAQEKTNAKSARVHS